MNIRFRFLVAFLATALATIAEDGVKPVSVWDAEAQLYGGLGWRNNVLRTGVMAEDSAFFQTSVDASLMWLSETDAFFMFYFFGDDIRYLDAEAVNYEQFLSATAQYTTPVGANNEASLLVNYLFQHQIVDASATEVDLRRVLVLGHGLSIKPSWKRLLPNQWALHFVGLANGQVYETQLDNYWEGGADAKLSKRYGHQSEASIAINPLVRSFDTREQVDLDGAAITDTRLIYYRTESTGAWRHNWDAEKKWRTLSEFKYLLNMDNGPGYFDYDRLQFRQRVQWRPERWRFDANIRLGSYFHHHQKVEDEKRWRSYAVFDFRVERELWSWLKTYATAEHEWSESNDPRDTYKSWMASLGLGFQF